MVKNYISSALLKGMAVASLVFGLGSGAAVAQSYTENFNTPSSIFTAGWAQQNLSNPVGTSAWFTGNPSAFVAYNGADSTYIGSNYNAVNNAGTISNWLFTPTRTYDNGHTFSFWTRTTTGTYPDRLQVRLSTNGASTNVGTTEVSTGDYGTLLLDINPTLTTTGYPTTWTQYTVTLSGLAGPTSGRIAFRYFVTGGGLNGTNSDYIGIDNVVYTVPVAGDATMLTSDTLEYTIVPIDHQSTDPFNGSIRNNGTTALTNVFMQVNVYNGSNTQVYTANSATTASLASGAVANFTVPAFTATASDVYVFEYIAKHSQADGNTLDDTLYSSVLIDPSVYARDNGTVTGGLGIGAGNGGFLGQQFELMQADRLDSVLVFMIGGTGYTGQPIAAAIWDMAAGAPNQIVGTTDTVFHVSDSGGVYILPIPGGLNLNAGLFTVTVIEFDSTAGLGQTNTIFTPGTTWVDWPTSPLAGWANNEDFGGQFAKPYVIRPFLNFCPAYVSNVTSTQSACGGATGTATVNVTGGPGPFTYAWSNGQTTPTATGLAAGNYTVTVSDAIGCNVVGQVSVTNPNAPVAGTPAITGVSCNGGTNGTITVPVTGGTAPFAYLWSNNATTSTLTAGAGTYSVTIADANLCAVVVTGMVINQPAALGATVNATNESAPGANDGTATANVTGGTPPYTYAWSNGGTTQTIAGLASGTYTVTVTDANQCTVNGSTSVVVGISDEFAGFSFGAYPNPSKGAFVVFVNAVELSDLSISVVDMMGKTVFVDNVSNTLSYQRNVDLGEKANGIYFLRVKAGTETHSYKIEVRN